MAKGGASEERGGVQRPAERTSLSDEKIPGVTEPGEKRPPSGH